MQSHQIVDLLAAWTEHGIEVFISGGWGVDALVGRQTREHNDLDVSLRTDEAEILESWLTENGFDLVVDWSPGRRAWRHADGREVDVHPLALDEDGTYRLITRDGQEFVMPPGSYVTGRIGDRAVGCLSVDKQLEFHRGYEPSATDLHDLELLRGLKSDV